jgi:hypothetical protein
MRLPAWGPEAQAAVEFILKQVDPADMHLLCDGGAIDVRIELLRIRDRELPHLRELWASECLGWPERHFFSTCAPLTTRRADIAVDTCGDVRAKEAKTVVWWRQLIRDLGVKFIVDVSPGSGWLAHAAMLSGAKYLGIARCPRHASWLQTTLDSHALDFMTKNGSPCFKGDPAQFIQQVNDEAMEGRSAGSRV